jgi:hypothetical protein
MPDQPDQEEEPTADDPADTVEESDEESFPASDPPSSWAGGAD